MYVAFHGDKKEDPKKEVSTVVSVAKPGEDKKDLTLSATSKVNKHNVTITVKFD